MTEGRVAKNTAFLLTAYVGQKVLTFAYFTIIARLVGVEGSGRYFVAVSFSVIFSVFLDLGLGNVITRETARLNENASKLIANVLGIKAVLAVVTVPATYVGAWLIGYAPETRTMIALAAFVTLLDSFSLVFYGVMRGFQNLRYEAIGIVVGQALTIIVGTTAMLLHWPLIWLVIALFTGSFWNALWSLRCLQKKYGVRIGFKLERPMLLHLWNMTAPFALLGIFSRIYSNVDSVMLSRLVSDTAVGYYGAAYKIVFAFMFLPTAFGAAIYPAMSEAYAVDRERLGRIFTIAMRYLLVVAAPIVGGIFVLSSELVRFAFGAQFEGSILPLQILIFSLISGFLYWPVGALLNACDRQSRNTIAMGTTMVVNVTINLLLIPHFGAVGAAIAALAGNIVLLALTIFYVRGLAPIRWHHLLTSSMRIGASAVVMGVVVWLIREAMPFPVAVLFGAVIYVGALLGFRGVTWNELRALLNMFLRRGSRKPMDIVA